MTRITIKTKARSTNRHYNQIADALIVGGYVAKTSNDDGDYVHIDTDAPRDVAAKLMECRPLSSVFFGK